MLWRLGSVLNVDDLTRTDDSDPNETAEWLDALEIGLSRGGRRAHD